MRQYHKIETVFERDLEGTKKLIKGSYRNDAVEYLSDKEWAFTEKIDGTNIRVYWDGHKVSFYGRTDKATIPKHLQERLDAIFSTSEAEQLFEQLFGEKEVLLFGEGYGNKIQTGHEYRSDVDFILFDVLIGDTYLRRPDIFDIAKAFGISVVPLIMIGTIDEAVAYIEEKPKSTFGTASMEGLVGKPAVEMFDRNGNRIIVKIKARDFA